MRMKLTMLTSFAVGSWLAWSALAAENGADARDTLRRSARAYDQGRSERPERPGKVAKASELTDKNANRSDGWEL